MKKKRVISEAQRRWMFAQKPKEEPALKEPGKVPGLKYWKRGAQVILDKRKEEKDGTDTVPGQA